MSRARASTFVAVVVAVLSACSSFTTSPSTAPDDGGTSPADASQQGLLDASNDGAPGDFTELSTGWTSLRGVAADENSVYFTEQGTGFMHVVPLAGGEVSTPGAQIAGAPLGVVLVAGSVVWLDDAKSAVRVWRAGDAASSSSNILSPEPFALAPAAKEIAFMLAHDSDSATSGVLQSRAINKLDLVASSVDGLAGPLDLAVRGSEIYVTQSGSSSIGHYTAALNGELKAQAALATAEADCTLIAASSLGVAWTVGKGVVRVALSAQPGLALPTTLASNEDDILALAADDTAFYWIRSDGVVRRLRPGDVAAETIGSGFDALRSASTHALTTTSAYVVVLTDDGRVLRFSKPK